MEAFSTSSRFCSRVSSTLMPVWAVKASHTSCPVSYTHLLYANDVANVKLFEIGIGPVAHIVAAHINFNIALVVAQVGNCLLYTSRCV